VTEPPVVNASPLIYLGYAGLIPLLQGAGSPVLVTETVAEEIRRRGLRDPTVQILSAVSWLKEVKPVVERPEVTLWDLGAGETSVLSWALQHPGCMAILDDRAARRCAQALGIPLIGTLGLVLRAKRQGQIAAARPILRKLREVGMYLSDRIVEQALRLVGE